MVKAPAISEANVETASRSMYSPCTCAAESASPAPTKPTQRRSNLAYGKALCGSDTDANIPTELSSNSSPSHRSPRQGGPHRVELVGHVGDAMNLGR